MTELTIIMELYFQQNLFYNASQVFNVTVSLNLKEVRRKK